MCFVSYEWESRVRHPVISRGKLRGIVSRSLSKLHIYKKSLHLYFWILSNHISSPTQVMPETDLKIKAVPGDWAGVFHVQTAPKKSEGSLSTHLYQVQELTRNSICFLGSNGWGRTICEFASSHCSRKPSADEKQSQSESHVVDPA